MTFTLCRINLMLMDPFQFYLVCCTQFTLALKHWKLFKVWFQHYFTVVWPWFGLVGLTHCFLMDNGETTEFGGVSRQLAIQVVNSVISPVVIFYSLYSPHSFNDDSPKLMWFLDVRRYCPDLLYLDSCWYDSVIHRLGQESLQGDKGASTLSFCIVSGDESATVRLCLGVLWTSGQVWPIRVDHSLMIFWLVYQSLDDCLGCIQSLRSTTCQG